MLAEALHDRFGLASRIVGPAVMVVFIVFGGTYVNPASVPAPLRWVPRASLIKHAFEGLAVNEFDGLTFDPSSPGGRPRPGDMTTGDAVLARLGYGESTVASALAAQARVLLFNSWTALALLRARAPAYALADGTRVEEEEEEEGVETNA